MMNRVKFLLPLLLSLFIFSAPPAQAQDKPYKDGTVWQISFIKVKPGMFDTYMGELLPMRKKIYEEARKQGLVLSEKMLSGDAFGNSDFNIVLMTEFKNFAALDGLSDKYDAIMSKVVGSQDAQVKTMIKRTEVRDIVGEKLMQEIVYK